MSAVSAPAAEAVPGSEPLLGLRGVKAYYGSIIALKGVDIDVYDGEIVALIGANGAGKSTLMMTIFGNPRAREGRIVFAGRDITDLPTHEIAHLRIAQAPEGRRIFARMSVLENLQMGATTAEPAHFAKDLERVFALFPRLKERLPQRGGTLSGGEQQMLAIGRALMARPRPRSALPRSWSSRSSMPFASSTGAKSSPCSWSSRTPSMRSSSPTAAMSWSTA